MLQTRRSVARIGLRPCRLQWRGFTDPRPPDPTTTSRSTEDKPVNEPIGGGDSSGTESGHAASAGKHQPTHHKPHPEPVNEPLGRGFYATIAFLVTSFALYKYSRSSSSSPSATGDPDKQPLFTRYLQKLNYLQEEYSRRNLVHTKLVELASHDRHLFESNPRSGHLDLRFPEIFNTGSPRNIVAGSQANLDELQAYYHRKNEEAQASRVERLKQVTDSPEILGHEDVNDGGEKRRGFTSFLQAWGVIGKPAQKKS